MVSARPPRWYPAAALIYGAILLGWLTPEENGVVSVTLLGVGASLLIGIGAYHRLPQSLRHSPLGLPLWGALIGAGSTLTTILLMFFKTALHSHLFPDYPLFLMLAMLERLPSWALAGALLGAGVSLLKRSLA